MGHRHATILAGLALHLALGAAAPAQETMPAANGYRPSSYPELYNSGPFYPGTELRAMPGARAAAVAARAQLRRAESDLNNAVFDIRREFKRSSELREALAEEKEAFDALNAARADATAHLKSDESYVAALALRQQLSDRIRNEHEQDKPRLEQIWGMATLKLSYGATASAMEAAAVSADPDVKQARERLVEAGARVAELRENFDQAVRSSPEVLAARKAVADARIAVQASDAAYIEAAKVANVALDYAYYVSGRQYSPYYSPYGYYGYNPYAYGDGYRYNTIGYSFGYPISWWRPQPRAR